MNYYNNILWVLKNILFKYLNTNNIKNATFMKKFNSITMNLKINSFNIYMCVYIKLKTI